ncbi:MAG: hypothetical protein FJX75_28165 [Armatimonadetes bacterium]|nr:hypothetical protein [Armatimonadota bacterium]
MDAQTQERAGAQSGSDRGVLVGEVRKNSRETIRLRLTEYEGHALADLRVWANATIPGDPATPTRKGVCFSRALLGDVIALLERAQEADHAQ